jgi:hypothetical protein
MTTRYAYIVNGNTVWGPGPSPYYITLQNGDIWEISAHTVEESESIGIFVVTQIDKKEVDKKFFAANLPAYSISNGRPVETWTYFFIPAARDNMILSVDSYAEEVREHVATQFPGQYAEYEEVYREALEVNSLPVGQEIPAGVYTFLEADIDVTVSPTLGRVVQNVREAADLVLQTRNQWKIYGTEIRKNRLRVKKLIRDAATDEEAYQIYEDEIINGI